MYMPSQYIACVDRNFGLPFSPGSSSVKLNSKVNIACVLLGQLFDTVSKSNIILFKETNRILSGKKSAHFVAVPFYS